VTIYVPSPFELSRKRARAQSGSDEAMKPMNQRGSLVAVPLRKQMLEELQLHQSIPSTIETYLWLD